MTIRLALTAFAVSAALLASASVSQAQNSTVPGQPPGDTVTPTETDAEITRFRPSATVSQRLQREFLNSVRWSAGTELRDRLSAAFAERSPSEIWLELVSQHGLAADDLADTLGAYWVLNWITANGTYAATIDHAPIKRQLRTGFANDPNFLALGDLQKQTLAESYILNFLLEHALLNNALEREDTQMLEGLAAAAVLRFRQNMGLDLLTLVPGPEGFVTFELEARPSEQGE